MELYNNLKKSYVNLSKPTKTILHTAATVGCGFLDYSAGADCLESIANSQIAPAVIEGITTMVCGVTGLANGIITTYCIKGR